MSLILLLGACQDPFEVDLSDQERSLIIMSNIIAGQSPSAEVRSTVLLGDLNDVSYPEDAIISISNLDNSNDFIPLRYDSQLGLYTNTDRTIFEGNRYMLTVDVPSFAASTLTSTTTVPQADIVELEVKNIDEIVSQNEQSVKIDVDIDLSTLSVDTHYLRARFFLEELITIVDSNGMETQIVTDNSNYMACDELNYAEGVTCSNYDNSFFIDSKNSSRDILSVALLSPSHLIDNSTPGRLILELSTISESNYLFHINVANLIKSNESVIGEPVLNYSNISNGYGFFGSSNVKHDTIIL